MDLCLESLKLCVTKNMKNILMVDFIGNEIQEAIFKMNPMGAPRPDGFLKCFYQKNWLIIGKKVTSYAIEVLNQKISLDGTNDTFITLISKVKTHRSVGEYKPISFCNVIIYKIVAKIQANRLKLILHDIISPTQNVFVLGRLITDNGIIAYEILHSMHF